jgi:hypothetical protein
VLFFLIIIGQVNGQWKHDMDENGLVTIYKKGKSQITSGSTYGNYYGESSFTFYSNLNKNEDMILWVSFFKANNGDLILVPTHKLKVRVKISGLKPFSVYSLPSKGGLSIDLMGDFVNEIYKMKESGRILTISFVYKNEFGVKDIYKGSVIL